MNTIHGVHLRAALLVSCIALASSSAAQAQGFASDLVLTAKLESGEQVDLPGFPYADHFDCVRAAKKQEIGRKFDRGLIVTADGRTPSGTIIGARCVQRQPPRMGQ